VRVALFPTCVVDAVATEVGVATVRVLRRAGHEVSVPERSTCCGQPAWNSGYADEAAMVARTTLLALYSADVDAVVIPAGSCATMIKVFWRELFELAGTPDEVRKVRELAERTHELAKFLTDNGIPAGSVVNEPPTTYHRSCHMLRELRVTDEPERLLESVGIRPLAPGQDERCCGFGGTFAVKLPEVSTAMADAVLDTAIEHGAQQMVGCDASCLMHLRGRAEHRGLSLVFRHLASLLEDATRDAAES
jgi:L-lactate dehydrogenase complex protein LldE